MLNVWSSIYQNFTPPRRNLNFHELQFLSCIFLKQYNLEYPFFSWILTLLSCKWGYLILCISWLYCDLDQFPTIEVESYFICFEATSAAPKAPTGDILDVGTPFYQDGQLQVHVYWQTSTGMYQCTHTQYLHEFIWVSAIKINGAYNWSSSDTHCKTCFHHCVKWIQMDLYLD